MRGKSSKKPQYEIVVEKKDLATRSLSPTSQELFDLMHLTSCEHAVQRWKDAWLICPVCNGTTYYANGAAYVEHRVREDILV